MAEVVEVKGLKELSRKLKSLPANVARKHMRAAVAEGAKVVLYTAIGTVNANSRITGNLSDNIAISTSSRKRRGTVLNAVAKIGVRRLATAVVSRKKGTSYEYWKGIEFGNSRIQAEPFLRPAFETKKHQVLKFVVRRLKVGIEKEASRK